MAEGWTASRVRIAIAQLCHARGIDIALLYKALGVNAVKAESDALAHLAGIIDGLEAAEHPPVIDDRDNLPPRL